MTSYRYATITVTTAGSDPLSKLHPSLNEYFNYIQKGMACPMCSGVVTSKDHIALTIKCVRAVTVGTGAMVYEHGAWEICKYLMNTMPKLPKEPEPSEWGEYGL